MNATKEKLTPEQEKELKKYFDAYFKAKERERAAKTVTENAKNILFETIEKLPKGLWSGSTFRLNSNVVRCYEKTKLTYPKGFDKEGFMNSNQEYMVASPKINEELVIERLAAGSEYLEGFGFESSTHVLLAIEKS